MKLWLPIQQIKLDEEGLKSWAGWNLQEGYLKKTPLPLHFGKVTLYINQNNILRTINDMASSE